MFEVILADPPWAYYGAKDKWGAAAKFYPCMSDKELAFLDVPGILAPNGIVFLWTTSAKMESAIRILGAWGLEYRGVGFVWVKTTKDGRPIGARGVRPSITKPTTEFVICGSRVARGRPLPLASEAVPQVLLATVGSHSQKPDEIYDRIERLYPDATKAELFARTRRLRGGWTQMGNEIDGLDIREAIENAHTNLATK